MLNGNETFSSKLMHAFDVKPEENLPNNLDHSFQEN
jgi:hypothetical protein